MSMRTAEEWANEIRYGHNHGGIDTVVKQIQLDAMKEGARRAAEMAEGNEVWSGQQLILAAAEQLTEKDL